MFLKHTNVNQLPPTHHYHQPWNFSDPWQRRHKNWNCLLETLPFSPSPHTYSSITCDPLLDSTVAVKLCSWTYNYYYYYYYYYILKTHLRECLCKSGPVDFAGDTDLAHFLCVVRHSCTYTKTTIRLIGSPYFSEFYGNYISLERRPVVTLFKTLIWDNFGGQFTKNYGTQQKTNTTAMYINAILSIEATSIKQTGGLEWHLIGSLKSHAKTNQIQAKFLKNWGVLNWSN